MSLSLCALYVSSYKAVLMPIIPRNQNLTRSQVLKSAIASLLLLACITGIARTDKRKVSKKTKVKKVSTLALTGPKSKDGIHVQIHDYMFEFDRDVIRKLYNAEDLGLIESMMDQMEGQPVQEVDKFFRVMPAKWGLNNVSVYNHFMTELRAGRVYASHTHRNESYQSFYITRTKSSRGSTYLAYTMGKDDRVITTSAVRNMKRRYRNRYRGRKYRYRTHF